MSPSRRGSAGGKGRYVWVGVAALLVLLIGASFALSGQARSNAESEAGLSAERYVVSGLSSVLTPDVVERDIRDREYQDLLVDVQSGVMSDAHVVRVRIWKPDGDLIFSTAQLDDVEEFVAVGNTQIQQAADGETVSVVAGATQAPLAGLEGSDEPLLVTYVPLQFSDESAPAGVVEIDQRYSSILKDANGLWRPVQIGLGVALLGLGALFAISQRRSKRRETPRWSSKPSRQSDETRKLRDAEDRARAADRAKQLAEERLAQAEGRVAELEKAEVPPEIRTRLEELELKLRAGEAEREQATGEAKRLRSALTEREAELALVRDRTTSTEAEKARSVDAVLRVEQQHAEAEQRASAAGTLAAEAEGRAAQARTKVTELEAALRDADRRIADAVAEAMRAATETKRDEEARLSGELRAAQLEGSAMKLKLAELEEALRESESRRVAGETAVAELITTRADAAAAGAELEELRLGFQRATFELDTAREELEGSRAEFAASSAEGQAVKAELEVSRGERDRALGELERLRGERDGATAEAQASRAEVQGSRAEVQAAKDEAQAARNELEVSRTERDRVVAELDRVRGERDGATDEVQGSIVEVQAAKDEAQAARNELEVSRSERDRVVAELDRVRGELDEMTSEVRRLSAARDADREAGGTAEAEAGPGSAELEARLAELEALRRNEVSDLQRAQESLANTQVELMDTNRKLKAAEERVREMEGGGEASSRRGGAPEYRPASSEEDDATVWNYESSDAGLGSPFAGLASDESANGGGESEPEEPPEETLSLRERLARAAAARHRTVQPHD